MNKYNGNGSPRTYVICSGGKLNPDRPDIPEYAIREVEVICEALGETFGETAKVEECRKEVKTYINQVETGFRKTGEWSLGKRIDGSQAPHKEDDVDIRILETQPGKAGEYFLGKRVLKLQEPTKAQTAHEKRMLLEKRGYTDKDLEGIKDVFKGCDRRLVAEEVLCVQDTGPEKAMRILPFLDVNFSRKELEGIYSGMPVEERNTIENILFFKSKEYKAYLEAFKNSPRSRKDNKCMINTPPSEISPGTPSP